MRRNVIVQFIMVLVQSVIHSFGLMREDKVRHVQRAFSPDRHGTYTADTVDHYIVAGHLCRPLLLKFNHLVVGDMGIKIVTAANGFCPAELRFHNFNVHFSQKIPHGGMYLRFLAEGAGIVDGYRQSIIFWQTQTIQMVQYLHNVIVWMP